MEPYIVFGASAVALVFWHWMYHVAGDSHLSGDMYYTRQFAFVGGPISPPYCWRPLLPMLARVAGFRLVSYGSIVMVPLMIYHFVGGGWIGVALALGFIGNPHCFPFAVRNPEYDTGLTHLLLVAGLWAMSVNSLAAWPLLLLAALCRENIGLALGAIAVLWSPWLAIPAFGGVAVAYLTRNEDKENRHPLVESSSYATIVRWAKLKGGRAVHFAHVIQPLRGTPLVVPFVWGVVSPYTRMGLAGAAVIWAFALPASGQTRIICHSYAIFAAFVAALPVEWAWGFALLNTFWPLDYTLFDERGQEQFSYVGGPKMQHLLASTDTEEQGR